MFVNRAEWKPLELRQGDILVGIPFPFVSPADITLLGKLPAGGHADFPVISTTMRAWRDPNDVTYFTGQMTMKLCACMVVLQCCELRINNKGVLRDTAAITVCRIVPVKKTILEDPERLRSLHENRDPRIDIENVRSYKNYFGIGTGDGLSDGEWMVDFAQMASIPANEFPAIMDKKHAQLTDLERVKLKIKLGVFFAKPTDEELAANIAQDPWNAAAPAAAPAAPAAVEGEPVANAVPVAPPDNNL
jgi:hypothetical protein